MRELIELRDKINRLLEDVMKRAEPDLAPPQTGGDWLPKVDLYELPDRVVLRADLPGVSADNLDVRLEGGQLVLLGSRPQPTDIDASAIRRLERSFGSFARRYTLPDGIDHESVKAAYADGVLEVVVRKREETAVRRIPVRSE